MFTQFKLVMIAVTSIMSVVFTGCGVKEPEYETVFTKDAYVEEIDNGQIIVEVIKTETIETENIITENIITENEGF